MIHENFDDIISEYRIRDDDEVKRLRAEDMLEVRKQYLIRYVHEQLDHLGADQNQFEQYEVDAIRNLLNFDESIPRLFGDNHKII